MQILRKSFIVIGRFIGKCIDFFYPPFKRYFSLHFFRYGVTGVLNLVLSWFSYFVIFQFIVRKRNIDLGFYTLSGHTATYAINFVFILITGFLLQKYVTFTASDLRGRKQLVRYIQVALLNYFIGTFLLKLFVDEMGFFPTIANVLTSIITVFVSYFLQKKYTFRIDENKQK